MSRADLIAWKLEQLSKHNPQNNLKTIVAFIETLIDDPEAVIGEIKIDLAAELQKRQLGQVSYKQKLDADIATLQTLDVAAIAKNAKI